jgi:hypothetical protein
VIKGREHNFRTREMRGLFAVIERAHLNGPLQKFCNGQIQFSHIDEATGYLRIFCDENLMNLVSESGIKSQIGITRNRPRRHL